MQTRSLVAVDEHCMFDCSSERFELSPLQGNDFEALTKQSRPLYSRTPENFTQKLVVDFTERSEALLATVSTVETQGLNTASDQMCAASSKELFQKTSESQKSQSKICKKRRRKVARHKEPMSEVAPKNISEPLVRRKWHMLTKNQV